MATQNPFENEKPQLVHLEKDESHYEYCRMQMHEVDRTLRRAFICNTALCIVVCFLSVFRKYIACFDVLATPLALGDVKRPAAILTGGIFTIVIAMIVMIFGYLAWANYHTLNIVMEAWYALVTIVGVTRLDYLSALIGIVGAVFYFFAIRDMRKEQALSEMEGYPDFQEKFDISKSDIVIQTLLAHQGEHRTKSTLFTTDYSLRKKKKKPYYKNGSSLLGDQSQEKQEGEAGNALAAELQKYVANVNDAKKVRTAIAELEATAAADRREKAGISLKDMADIMEQPVSETAAPETEPAAEPQAEVTAAPAVTENIEPERADAEAAAAAILAEAEKKAAEILAAAEEKAKSLSQQADTALGHSEETPAEPVKEEAPAEKPAQETRSQNPNPNRKKKKKKH